MHPSDHGHLLSNHRTANGREMPEKKIADSLHELGTKAMKNISNLLHIATASGEES